MHGLRGDSKGEREAPGIKGQTNPSPNPPPSCTRRSTPGSPAAPRSGAFPRPMQPAACAGHLRLRPCHLRRVAENSSHLAVSTLRTRG